MDNHTHGGQRTGAGRKPLAPTEPTKKVAITLLASQIDAMTTLGNGNLSAGIRKAIENMNTGELQPNLLTVRALRLLLVQLDNQDMTVSELRRKLFDVDEQDKPLKIDRSTWHELGIA